MFKTIHNLVTRKALWAMTLVGGGLLGVGATATPAEAAYPTGVGHYYSAPNYFGTNASAAQINRNLNYQTQQQVWNANSRIHNWQYSQYNPYSPNYFGNVYPSYYPNYPYYPYYPYSSLYVAPPSVVYPYVSPYSSVSPY